jgi:hypothetical protein
MTADPDRIIAAVDEMLAPPRRPVSVCVSDVEPERVSWLWPGRIPFGKLTVLDGDPGTGKSTLTLELASRVSNGGPMPDGAMSEKPGKAGVVLVSAEDGAGDTIRPRLDAAGADVTRVHLLTDVDDIDDEGTRRRRPWTMPRDIDMLGALILSVGARLVIIDPMNAVLSTKVDAYRDQDVRVALAPLARVAQETGAAIVLVRHLTKGGGSNALYRGGGSIGIIGAARSGLLVAPDPNDEAGTRRVLAVTKANLATQATSLAYELVPAEEHVCARVRWLGESSHTSSSLLVPPPSKEERTAADEAVEFLRDALANGPRPAKELFSDARDAGHSKRTIERAKREIGVQSVKSGIDTGWLWTLGEERHAVGRQPTTPSELGGLRSDQGVCTSVNGNGAEGRQTCTLGGLRSDQGISTSLDGNVAEGRQPPTPGGLGGLRSDQDVFISLDGNVAEGRQAPRVATFEAPLSDGDLALFDGEDDS